MTRCDYHFTGTVYRCPRHPRQAALRWAPNRNRWVLDSLTHPGDHDWLDHRAAVTVMLSHLTGGHPPTITDTDWTAYLTMAALAAPDPAGIPLAVLRLLWDDATTTDGADGADDR